jgi:hypothetical protein
LYQSRRELHDIKTHNWVARKSHSLPVAVARLALPRGLSFVSRLNEVLCLNFFVVLSFHDLSIFDFAKKVFVALNRAARHRIRAAYHSIIIEELMAPSRRLRLRHFGSKASLIGKRSGEAAQLAAR